MTTDESTASHQDRQPGGQVASSTRTVAMRALLDEYGSAFAAANPGKHAPLMSYERGWFLQRYPVDGGVMNRYREADLVKMRDTLLRRAVPQAATDPDLEGTEQPDTAPAPGPR